mgnify:CR=1 FL=1
MHPRPRFTLPPALLAAVLAAHAAFAGSDRASAVHWSTDFESGVPPEVRRQLLRRGHRIQETEPAVFGGYQAIRRNPETGVYEGATESRKDGVAAGY